MAFKDWTIPQLMGFGSFGNVVACVIRAKGLNNASRSKIRELYMDDEGRMSVQSRPRALSIWTPNLDSFHTHRIPFLGTYPWNGSHKVP